MRIHRTHVAVPLRFLRAVALDAMLACFALIWLLPSPWGGLVPAVLLAQVAWLRLGAMPTSVATVASVAVGAALSPALGIGDARRTALALLLVVLSTMALWPAHERSARR